MLYSEPNVTIEIRNKEKGNIEKRMTNPLTSTTCQIEKIEEAVKKILSEEFPMIKNNSLLYNLVMYTITDKMNTVQKVENVLSYIKESCVKEVQEVNFENGEILITCSV